MQRNLPTFVASIKKAVLDGKHTAEKPLVVYYLNPDSHDPTDSRGFDFYFKPDSDTPKITPEDMDAVAAQMEAWEILFTYEQKSLYGAQGIIIRFYRNPLHSEEKEHRHGMCAACVLI